MARLKDGTQVAAGEKRRAAAAYLPALDGLRAVAVFAVIAYHLDLGWAGGGYLGVDLFFVLSGYLITSLLVGEWARSGRIGFGSFWVRRARRLLPAVILLLLTLALYAGLGGPGLDRSALRPDALFTLFYSANWHQVFAHQSYFSQFQAPSPLRHTWSLAIEEQFYVVWPLILMVLLVLARGSRRFALLVTGLLAAGSALLMAVLYHPGIDPSRVYYGTDTRAFELLVGATLALVLAGGAPLHRRTGRRLLHGAGLVSMGLLVYAFSAEAGPPGWMYRGGLLAGTVLVAVVIASITQPRPGPLGALLSVPPLRWIGRISYGLYLWHWPVVVLATDTTTGLSGYPLTILRVGLTLALAAASYYMIERPIRQASLAGWRGRALAPAGLAVTASALVFATVPATTSIAAAAGPSPGAAVVSPAGAATGGAAPAGPSRPSAASSAATDPVSVMIVGDSTARTLADGLSDLQARSGIAVHDATELGCTIVRDWTEHDVYGTNQAATPQPDCDWPKTWPADLDRFHPRVVLMLYGPWDTSDYLIGGHWLRVGTAEWQSYYQDQLTQMTALLTSQGARLVLATAPRYHAAPDAMSSHPTFNDPRRVAALDSVYRTFATANPSVDLYDLAAQVGADDLRDGVHFGRTAADRLAASLDPALQHVASTTAQAGATGPPTYRVRR